MKIKSERAHGVVMEKLCSHIGSFPERKEYPVTLPQVFTWQKAGPLGGLAYQADRVTLALG